MSSTVTTCPVAMPPMLPSIGEEDIFGSATESASVRILPAMPAQGTMMGISLSSVFGRQWKKEQASRCYTADVYLCQSVNQLYNNQKMVKLALFSAVWSLVPYFIAQ